MKIDENHVAETIEAASEKLAGADGELLLDFSSVRRIDVAALKALEKLVRIAGERPVKLVLGGVNVEVYKVLKLMKLAPRFAFVT